MITSQDWFIMLTSALEAATSQRLIECIWPSKMLVTILILWSNNRIYFRFHKRKKNKKILLNICMCHFIPQDSLSFSLCVHTRTHAHVHMHVRVQLWRPTDNLSYCPSGVIHLDCWDMVSLWDLGLTSLPKLAGNLGLGFCLSLPFKWWDYKQHCHIRIL